MSRQPDQPVARPRLAAAALIGKFSDHRTAGQWDYATEDQLLMGALIYTLQDLADAVRECKADRR